MPPESVLDIFVVNVLLTIICSVEKCIIRHTAHRSSVSSLEENYLPLDGLIRELLPCLLFLDDSPSRSAEPASTSR